MPQVEFATFRSSENAGIPRRCGRRLRERGITISKRSRSQRRIETLEMGEHNNNNIGIMSSRDKQNVKQLALTNKKIHITNSKSQQLNIAIQLFLFFLMLNNNNNNNNASATLMAPNEMRSLDDYTALESRAEDDELSKTMAGNLLLDEATGNLNAELQQQSHFQPALESTNVINSNYNGNKTNWPADFGGQAEPSELSQIQSSSNVTIDNQQPINGTNFTSGGLVEVHEPGIYLPPAEEEKSTATTAKKLKKRKKKKKKKKRKQETKLKVVQLNELSSLSQESPQHMISYVTSRRPTGSRAPEAQQQLASPLKFIQFSRGLNNFYNLLPVNFVGQKQSPLPGERSLPLGASNQSLATAVVPYGDGAGAHKVNGPFELEQLQATETRANGKSAASSEDFTRVEENDDGDDRDEPLDDEDDEREPLKAAVNQTATTSDLKITRQAHHSTPSEQHASSSTGTSSVSVVRQQQHYEQHELDGGGGATNKTKSTSGPEVDPPKTSSGGGSDQVVAMKTPTQALGGNNELLVGPFKSEAEAPATITLAGVVYQKSGASSALIRTSASRGAPALLAPPQMMQATSPYDDWMAPVSMQPVIYSQPTDYQQQQQASLVRFSPFSLASSPSGGELTLSSSNQKAATTKLMPTSSLYPPAGQQLSLGSQLEHAQSLLGATQSSSLHRLPGGTTIWTIGKSATVGGGQQAELSGSSQVGLDTSESKAHSTGDKHAPIVIVQKDVKPVKYHLLRAYLKLRRLLRPFEATYVFPGESAALGGSRAALDRSTAGGGGGGLLTRNRRWRRRRRQRLSLLSREE